MRTLGKGESFPIRPEHINADEHFFDAFGNMETEISAHYIVKMCQRRGTWAPFAVEEIEAEYNKAGHRDFWWNRLISRKWIVEDGDMLHITDEFVTRCFQSRPTEKCTQSGRLRSLMGHLYRRLFRKGRR